MPRKPVDIAHVNLRIRESLRRKLEREAERHQTSMNNEIRVRLENSFRIEADRDVDAVAGSEIELGAVRDTTLALGFGGSTRRGDHAGGRRPGMQTSLALG